MKTFVSFPKSGRTWLRAMLLDLGYKHDVFSHQLQDEKTSCFYILREPKDVLVSWYFEVTKRNGWISKRKTTRYPIYTGKIANFVLNSCENELIPFLLQVLQRIEKGAPFITYEQMATDPIAALNKAADFLQLDVTYEILYQTVNNNCFEKMRAREEAGGQPRWLRPGRRDDYESYKTRRGVVRGYVDYLAPEVIEQLNTKLKRLASLYGLCEWTL